MKHLSGQVVIVTGGSRGIGEAIVRRLAAEGAIVYGISSKPSEHIADIETSVAADGGIVRFKTADVSDDGQVRTCIEEIVAAEGRIDAVVNNAGITKDGLLMRMSEADWDAVLDVNLKSVFLMTKAVSRPMMAQRRGRIVNITSVVGITGNAGQSNYCASKAGMIGFTKATAKELASRNILVNCIAPGYIETEMTGKLSEDQRTAFTEAIPLRRGGSGADVAGVVNFLLSADSSYITGQTFCVDGGMVMQ
ncbi:MAG: 3-oxoacyl-[acyl-carrier-protein] reductase [Candidatus Kapaibacterium sp.]